VAGANAALLVEGASLKAADLPRTIERRAGHDKRVILRLDGCTSRSDAEALRGADLLVSRDAVPELGPDEWWAEELEGCAVVDGSRPVGIVARMLVLPSCEVLEVVRGEGVEDLLVPLVGDAVRTVDVVERVIDIDLQFLGQA
jgi:16S rRNA processing protein RimM